MPKPDIAALMQMVAERDASIRAACLHALEVLYCQEGAPEVKSSQLEALAWLPVQKSAGSLSWIADMRTVNAVYSQQLGLNSASACRDSRLSACWKSHMHLSEVRAGRR